MRQIASLKCIEQANPEAENVFILFHGYGADAYDLQTLSEVLITREPYEWIFPQGFLEVPIGPGWTGRAWWPVDMEKLQRAVMSGEIRDMADMQPEGMMKARERAMGMLEELINKRGLKWSQIVLGGFSQGAMLATELFLSAPETCKGLMIMSGALLDKNRWRELAPKRAGAKVFMSHGKQDAVLSIRGASQLETLFNQAGIKTRLNSFEGGHEIPPGIIMLANEWLKTV